MTMAKLDAGAFRKTLDEKREKARILHFNGADGHSVCKEISRAVDETIAQLFEADNDSFDGALVALGGYGRGLLNPFSDVDLLFLLKNGGSAPPASILTALWDIGLKVGHSSRSIRDTIAVGRADLTARTSMVESRFLCGNSELYEDFHKKYLREVIRKGSGAFIVAKKEEMEIRHATHGKVIRLTEPDIKESPGGLRDLHTAWWAIRSKITINSLSELAELGAVSQKAVDSVTLAHSFLLRLRNALHFNVNKLEDVLIQPLQPTIGRDEGFEGSDNEVAAELMKKYYSTAHVINNFASDVVDFAYNYKRMKFWRPIRTDRYGLFSDGEKLHAKSFPTEGYENSLELLLQIATRLSKENLALSPNLRRSLKKLSAEAPPKLFEGKEAGRCLMEILKLYNSAKALEAFRNVGIIDRFIPEFIAINGLSQFDMFHRYSTDEHTLTAIKKLEGIASGSAPVASLLVDILRTQPDLEVVKLALLLHDLGKRAEDYHAVEKDIRTPVILKRLGLSSLGSAVGFLVREHLLMSVVAQHHDFLRPETLKRFCRKVRNRDRLRRLYLLTYSDISAVGPGVWSDWKNKLLVDLYLRAEQFFIKGDAIFRSNDEQLTALTLKVIKQPGRAVSEEEVHDFIARAPENYTRNAYPERVAEDALFAQKLESGSVALRFQQNPGDLTGNLTIAGTERLGFFSVVAGALAAERMGIVEAQIHTFKDHMALDTITVHGKNLTMLSDDRSLERFRQELLAFLNGEKDFRDLVSGRTRYMRKENRAGSAYAEPEAFVLNHLFENLSVIETRAQDRIGLLYDITRILAKMELSIASAKIYTQGPRATNVFYVTTENEKKIEDKEQQKEIVEALVSAIKSPAGED
ncbi:[Protein-PII] uridylyltransferase / [Protein-PII]-UMP uridylyl-removing enzyme [hydrothermal vent metagenome]|uniref:[Protein-PII] uridylyltransferase / [Protein-PII]-UMP uridylyl-removing enzyme n=1 Tax=hydrothermal vent metagenome TaxID=652676 RepID=A0A3B1C267_9ZZZZ